MEDFEKLYQERREDFIRKRTQMESQITTLATAIEKMPQWLREKYELPDNLGELKDLIPCLYNDDVEQYRKDFAEQLFKANKIIETYNAAVSEYYSVGHTLYTELQESIAR